MASGAALLAFVSLNWFAALYFYCRGFLLTRTALSSRSRCSDVHQQLGGNATGAECWLTPRYNRTILLLIDALRHDFVEWQDHVSPNTTLPPYHNRMRCVRDLMRSEPRNCFLSVFVADPPTTTLQRLKGLTTGSLPTFIDAGSNFAGAEVTEDNWLDQLTSRGRKIVFMGDDTWTSLYPGRFARSYPFPSFDVRDLHTVDEGVLRHIYDELREDDWTVLVAHFLGVDHAGHKYGPGHAEMGKKLDQMNGVILNITQQMDDSTVLFVLGDHGMTSTGDHGGDSDNELRAALFAYAKPGRPLHDNFGPVLPPVAQIDLVPTLSLLLDSPIPFSSLGSLIPSMFPGETLKAAAARANVAQVLRYAEEYTVTLSKAAAAGDSGGLTSRLSPALRMLQNADPADNGAQQTSRAITKVQDIFRETWAKFHTGWMALGLCAMFETLLWTARLAAVGDAMRGRRLVLKLLSVGMQVLAAGAQIEAVPPALGLLLLAQVFVDTIALALHAVDLDTRWTGLNAFSLALVLLHAASFFSNSFVINEHAVLRFLCSTFVAVLFYQICAENVQSVWPQLRRTQAKTSRSLRLMYASMFGWRPTLYSLLMLICLACAQLFMRCREELFKCEQSLSTLTFGALSDDSWLKTLRLLAAICALWGQVFLTGRFLQKNGHLNGHGVVQMLLQIVPRLCAAAISFYWLAQWLPENVVHRHSWLLEYVPPAAVYLSASTFTVVFFARPLVTSIESGTPADALSGDVDPSDKRALFNHFKHNLSTYLSSPRSLIYGLATCYSGSLVSLASVWLPVLAMLLGDGLAPALLLFTCAVSGAMELLALSGRGEAVEARFILWPMPTQCACLWSLLSAHGFYATGHAAAFVAIPWHAAFVGLPGNFAVQAAPAALVALNVFAAHVVCALAVPLLVVWPVYPDKVGSWALMPAQGKGSRPMATEWNLLAERESTLRAVSVVSLAYLAAAGLKLMAATGACALHRRHLMLWKIFAPKFIFEGLSFIATCVFLVLINWIISRIKPPHQVIVNAD